MNKTTLGLRTQSGIEVRQRRVVVDDIEYDVPKGIARNNRNQSWQLKLERNGVKLATGNYADRTYGDTARALSAAKTAMGNALQSDEARDTGPRAVRGGRTEGLRAGLHLTINWRIVNATPSLYATVYSPLLKKAKSIHLGSDKMMPKKPDRLLYKLGLALYMNDQVLLESADPFADVPSVEPEYLKHAVKLIETGEFIAMLEAGPQLREQAEKMRGAGYRLSQIV